jgi:hypothetical protein
MVVMARSSLDISWEVLYKYVYLIEAISSEVKRNRRNAGMRNKSECARVGHTLDTIAETESMALSGAALGVGGE